MGVETNIPSQTSSLSLSFLSIVIFKCADWCVCLDKETSFTASAEIVLFFESIAQGDQNFQTALSPSSKESKRIKIISYFLLILFVINQGSFSYWRSWEEYKSPYLDDIGYIKILANKIAGHCSDKPQIRFASKHGLKNTDEMFHYLFEPQFKGLNKTGTILCHSILVFQNKLFLQSRILSWYLKQLEPIKKMEEYNSQIWIMGRK